MNGLSFYGENVYGQKQNKDGSWSGVTLDNKPIDVDYNGIRTRTKRTVSNKPLVGPPQPSPETRATNQMASNTIEAGKLVSKATRDQTSVLKEQYAKEEMKENALAAAEFFVDVLNAQAGYNAAIGQAGQNILAARNSGADALFLGRQAQLTAQSEGYNAGQDAKIAMAAQGQDVNSAGVGKVQGSYEAMGVQAGMRQYNNSIAEALGFEVEEFNIEAQLKAAKAARNAAIIGSGLKLAVGVGI